MSGNKKYIVALAKLNVAAYYDVAERLSSDEIFHRLLANTLVRNNPSLGYRMTRGRLSASMERVCQVFSLQLQDEARQVKILRRHPDTYDKINYFRTNGISPEQLTLADEAAFLLGKHGSIDDVLNSERSRLRNTDTSSCLAHPLQRLAKLSFEFTFGKGSSLRITNSVYNSFIAPVFRSQLEAYVNSSQKQLS